MPVHTNSIGTQAGGYFVFFDLVGTVAHSQTQTEVITRPGVNGTGVRNTGSRGKPFDLESTTYFSSFAEADVAFLLYLAISGTSKVEIWRHSNLLGSSFVVLEVQESYPPFAIYNVAGAAGAECCAKHKWTLVEVT